MVWAFRRSTGAGAGQSQGAFLAASGAAEHEQREGTGAKNLGQGHGNLWGEGWNKGAAYNDQQ
jgi:hypothetical protein